jgi:hypothetical protein
MAQPTFTFTVVMYFDSCFFPVEVKQWDRNTVPNRDLLHLVVAEPIFREASQFQREILNQRVGRE